MCIPSSLLQWTHICTGKHLLYFTEQKSDFWAISSFRQSSFSCWCVSQITRITDALKKNAHDQNEQTIRRLDWTLFDIWRELVKHPAVHSCWFIDYLTMNCTTRRNSYKRNCLTGNNASCAYHRMGYTSDWLCLNEPWDANEAEMSLNCTSLARTRLISSKQTTCKYKNLAFMPNPNMAHYIRDLCILSARHILRRTTDASKPRSK